MFKTTVSKKYFEERHPVWYKRLTIAPNRQEVAKTSSPETASPQTVDA
jgi:hypothetical protein